MPLSSISTVIHNCRKLCFLAHLVTSTALVSFGEVPRDQCCNGTKRGGSLPGDRPPGVEAGTYRGPDVTLACCLKFETKEPMIFCVFAVSRVTVCWNVSEYVPWCFTKIDHLRFAPCVSLERYFQRPVFALKKVVWNVLTSKPLGFSFDLNAEPCLYVVQYLSW